MGAAFTFSAGCAHVKPRRAENSGRKRIALIATIVRKYPTRSTLGSFPRGYAWQGRWHHPQVDLVSLYVDHPGRRPQSSARNVSACIYPTIASAHSAARNSPWMVW